MIVNYGVERLDTDDRDAGTAMYSSAKEVFVAYTESDGERVGSARRRSEPGVSLRWISALLNLYSEKKNKA